jgi:6-pyruvoyltetrahydropterin/6-carboxytetrahydropterin synthase
MKKTFSVELEKEVLIFSAAHFITFDDHSGNEICESVHGHNYRVAARVTGKLDEHACVVDFIWLRDTLKKLVARLDHHILLPDSHPRIEVNHENDEFEVRYANRRWVFPEEDVALLPVDNTTAERLAEYLLEQLAKELEQLGGVSLDQLSVGVDENEGQWAWCHGSIS